MKKPPTALGKILSEPEDGTHLMLVTYSGEKILVWRDDRTAKSRSESANREDRWFDSDNPFILPVDWDEITSGTRGIYPVGRKPLIGK